MSSKLFFLLTLFPIFAISTNLIEIAELFAPFSGPGTNPCANEPKKYAENPRGCAWLWMCRDENGTAIREPFEARCPEDPDTVFNYNTQSCIYRADSSCRLDDDLFRRTPIECTNWRMDLIPHPLDCSKYFLCWENYTIPQQCPGGSYFSYFQNGCTEERLAECLNEHNFCRRMNADNLQAKRNPDSCETYHVCYKCGARFKTIELNCFNGTHQFDNENEQCDVTGNVECTITEPIIPVDMPIEPFSIQCTDEHISKRNVPHPRNNTFFFECSSGRSYLSQCPPGTIFNKDRNQCWI